MRSLVPYGKRFSTLCQRKRVGRDAGIAIGPILFVIAVLGILASAIAAGSGSFTAGSASEGNRAKASAIIEIGQNLKVGWDRVTSYGTFFDDVVIDLTQTDGTTDLFSPTGGGITFPSSTQSNVGTDLWYYPWSHFPSMGDDVERDRLAVLEVSRGVCDEINNKAMGIATPAQATIAAADIELNTAVDAAVDTALAPFAGRMTGCINATGGYFFYQVLGVR